MMRTRSSICLNQPTGTGPTQQVHHSPLLTAMQDIIVHIPDYGAFNHLIVYSVLCCLIDVFHQYRYIYCEPTPRADFPSVY